MLARIFSLFIFLLKSKGKSLPNKLKLIYTNLEYKRFFRLPCNSTVIYATIVRFFHLHGSHGSYYWH